MRRSAQTLSSHKQTVLPAPTGRTLRGIFMERQHVLELVNQVLTNQGKQPAKDDATPMADTGFRSLDFSQVALRIEDELERELNFSAAAMRRITTIRDVIDFFVEATQSSADV